MTHRPQYIMDKALNERADSRAPVPLSPASLLGSLPDTTRGKLLRAFAVVISCKGLRQVTVQDVLDEADYSRRTFYQHFSGLEDALVALFDHVASATVSSMTAATEPDSEGAVVDKIMEVIEVYLDAQRQTGPLSLIFYTEAMRPESPLAPRRVGILDGLTQMMRQRAELAVGQPLDALLLRAMILSVEAMVMHFKAQDRFDEEARARVLASATAIISRTLLPEQATPCGLPAPKKQ